MNDQEFTGTFPLQLSPKIIQHISSSMYRSPASAIKELLINSFDADARNVELSLTFGNPFLRGKRITKICVKDDGVGMDGQKLRRIFSQIGDSLKSREGKSPNDDMVTEKLHRPLVGRLGIGMLAIASATSSFKIISKKENSNQLYTCDVNIAQFDKAIEKISAIEDFPMGKVRISSETVENSKEGYTIVEVTKFKPPFMTYINHDVEKSFIFKNPCHPNELGEYDYEGYFEKYLDVLYDKKRLSEMTQLDQTVIQLGNIIPVRYLEKGPIKRRFLFNDKEYEIINSGGNTINTIKERLEKYNFNVKIIIKDENENVINSFYIFKPQLFPTKSILEEYKEENRPIEQLKPNVFEFSHTYNIGTKENERKVEVNGYVYHQNARINPREYRGLLYRVYNVAIGEEYKDDLRIYSNNPIAIHQTSIEVYLDKGFQSVVNIDRETFYQAGDAFQYLKAYLEHTLSGGGKFLEDVKNEGVRIVRLSTLKNEPSVKQDSVKQETQEIYHKIREAFREPNKNPIIKQIIGDMQDGRTAKLERDIQREKPEPIIDYIKKMNIARSIEVKPTNIIGEATLRVEDQVAVYSLPSVKTRNKRLFEEVSEFVLLHSMKDGTSRLSKEEVDLLAKLINDFA